MRKFQSSRRLWIVIALVVFLMLVVGQASAAPSLNLASASNDEHPVGIVTAGALNVRTGPDVSYRSIAIVYQGQMVSLLGRWATNNWVHVRLWNGLEGWVNSVYLQTSVPISELPVLGGTPDEQPTPVPPIAGPTATVNTGALNVRLGPGLTYRSIAVVTQGQQLLLIGRNASATWVKVQLTNGTVGWVNVYYLQTSVSPVTLPIADESPPDSSQAIGVVNTGAVNVRSGPGIQYISVAVLGNGTSVTLIGRNTEGTWVQVRTTDDVEGWINATLLQTSVPILSLPVVESAPPENAAVVNVGALNVRYGPGTGYDAFAVVYRGQVVTMMGRSATNTWVQVRIPSGAVGWVNSNQLLSEVPFTSLPVTGP